MDEKVPNLNVLYPDSTMSDQMAKSIQECIHAHNHTLQLSVPIQQQNEVLMERVKKTQEITK